MPPVCPNWPVCCVTYALTPPSLLPNEIMQQTISFKEQYNMSQRTHLNIFLSLCYTVSTANRSSLFFPIFPCESINYSIVFVLAYPENLSFIWIEMKRKKSRKNSQIYLGNNKFKHIKPDILEGDETVYYGNITIQRC